MRVAVVDALGEMGADGKEAAPKLARLFHDPSGACASMCRKAWHRLDRRLSNR